MTKKLLLGLALLLLVGAGVAAWFWRQATALPDWYGEFEMPSELPETGPNAELPDWSWVPDATASEEPSPPPTTRRRARREMRNFHLRTHVSNPAAREAFRASRAVYEDGHLEAGVIINVGKVPRDQLSAKDRGFFDRVAKAFPSLARRDVYVALEDDPITAPDGILQLGPRPRVRVGKLSYSLNQVARKLGVSSKAVRRDINRELRRMKVKDPKALERLNPPPNP